MKRLKLKHPISLHNALETDDEAALAELRAGMARGKHVEQQVRLDQQRETQRMYISILFLSCFSRF